MNRSGRGAGSPRRWRNAAVALALVLGACDVVTLEPDPDLGDLAVGDAGLPPPLLGDGRMPDPDLAPPEPDAAPDAGAAAEFSPTRVEFGAVEPYTRVRRSVRLRAGADPVRIESVGVGGPDFALSADSPRAPLVVWPGGVVHWTVEFAPEVAGRRSAGELTVVSEDGVRRIPLSGEGAWSATPCTPWAVEIEPPPPGAIEPQTPLYLVAKPPVSLELGDVGLRWSTLASPDEQVVQPWERFIDPRRPQAGGLPDDPASLIAVAFADKPGRYVFRATPLLPPDAMCAPPPSDLTVHVCPCPERLLHVRIGWRRTAGAPPVRIRPEPAAVDGSAVAWTDGVNRSAPRAEWGRPGPLDDARLDLEPGQDRGRVDVWIAEGELPSVLRLGLGLFDAAGSDATTVDASLELLIGGTSLASIERRAIATGTAWDIGALVARPGGPRFLPYDRVFEARPGQWPDLQEPLSPDTACEPGLGPPCAPGTSCRLGPDGRRCRP